MPVFAVEYSYDQQAERRNAVRPAHRAFLAALHEQGRLIASGPLEGGSAALLLVHAADASDARDLLEPDPFATAGLLAQVTVRSWSPVIGSLSHLA